MKDVIEAKELLRAGSFYRDAKLQGHKPSIEFLEDPTLIEADAEVAENLELSRGTLVLKRHRLQLIDGLPYRLIESYYPADLFGELLTTDIKNKPLFEWLQERYGIRVNHVKEELKARLATMPESHLLGITPESPVVALNRTVLAMNKHPVEWAKVVVVGERSTFPYEYDIPAWS